MANDPLFNLIKRIQTYIHKIEPVLDFVNQTKLLLDRLEQVEHVESRMGQVRLIVDAVDDFLKEMSRIKSGQRPQGKECEDLRR
ncbi:TPA: hypothetical protein EYP37_01270 [Candidatus Poribacteria bacterium]|nr:hypothetical protein [Candidatus Poribacteria bacterium]